MYANESYPGDVGTLWPTSVSISSKYAIIGSIGYISISGNTGTVLENYARTYIFEYIDSNSKWELMSRILGGDSQIGNSVSIDSVSGLAIVGSSGYPTYGASYIYQRNDSTGNWNRLKKLTPNNTNTCYFGASVSVYRETFLVTGYSNCSYMYSYLSAEERVYVYEYEYDYDYDSNSTVHVSLIAEDTFGVNGTSKQYYGDGDPMDNVCLFKDLGIIGLANNDSSYIFGGFEPSFSPTTIPTAAPTTSPALAPTNAPTIPPSAAPTGSPTMKLCDTTLQKKDTFVACKFLVELNFQDRVLNGYELIHSNNYCVGEMSVYFKCLSDHDNETITHIFLNNSNIDGPLTKNATMFLYKLAKYSLISLDLSDNEITGPIPDWSNFAFLQILILANNSFTGSADFKQLVEGNSQNSYNVSSLTKVDLSNNNFASGNKYCTIPNSFFVFQFCCDGV